MTDERLNIDRKTASLFVELVFGLILLDVVLVSLLEVLGEDDVAVLADGVHTRLLHS